MVRGFFQNFLVALQRLRGADSSTANRLKRGQTGLVGLGLRLARCASRASCRCCASKLCDAAIAIAARDEQILSAGSRSKEDS